MDEIENKQYFKKLKAANILFLIGQVCIIASIFSTASKFKFFPRWIENFVVFAILGFILFFIASLLVRKHNKSFVYALITDGLMVSMSLVGAICETSNDGLYRAWATGLNWSLDILLLIFYYYYFQAAHLVFEEHSDIEKHSKTKIACLVFCSFSVTNLILKLVGKMSFISRNIIANRIFSYGTWILDFVICFFALIIAINILIGTIKMKKEDSHHE